MFDESEDQASYSFEELWAKARRGRWWILLPLFLCWLTVWGISWLLPTTYESEALILVEQQKVPEQYVVSNVTVNLQERLQSITQKILSRTQLQKIIDLRHLYPPRQGLGKLLQEADPVEQMRKDIKIELVQTPGRPNDLTAFKINYSAGSSELAQQVNEEITSLFIEESQSSQQQLSKSTSDFFDDELKAASDKLAEKEAKLRDFKAKHLGNLPSQLQSNVEILSGLQAQLQNTQRALDGARQQNLYLESQLQQYQQAQGALGGDAGASSLDSLQKQLLVLRSSLAEERSRHTENYPDIVSLKGKISETEKLIKELEAGAGSKQKQDGADTAARQRAGDTPTPIASTPLMQVRSQLKANELEIKNYQQQEKNIESQIATYQARLNLTPATEEELAETSRGYEELKANYNSLLQKRNQSHLATNLEHTDRGEQFHILDFPSSPDKPKSPNHLLLSLAGLGFGFAVGVGLLVLREVMNARVQQEGDLEGIAPARILVRVPHLFTPRERRFRMVSRWLEGAAFAVIALLIVVGNLYSFYKG